MTPESRFKRAFDTRDIAEFLALTFPREWESLASRVIETGVSMSITDCAWAPRWSAIPPTVRVGDSDFETHVKSCIFRVHDCIHQLWGLMKPDRDLDAETMRTFKRSQMCGEIATLVLTEFVFCRHVCETAPQAAPLLAKRNALKMLDGPLAGKTPSQIAARVDCLLHRRVTPDWIINDAASLAFCRDYVPMLEHDRRCIDHNLKIMKLTRWRPPEEIPDARYNPLMDGLELTLWMIEDFFHLAATGRGVDESLRVFNAERRSRLMLPAEWNNPC